MKKAAAIIMTVFMALAMAACGGGSSEEAAVDTVRQHLRIDGNAPCSLPHAHRQRKLIPILTDEVIAAILVVHLDGEGVGIHIKLDGLF